MKEIQHIIEAYQHASTPLALATVVRVEGSSYRRVGARMLVQPNGEYLGGISGGCLEGDALKRARLAIHTQKASSVVYDTTTDDPHQIGIGLGCNGIIEVLFAPLVSGTPHNPVEVLASCIKERKIQVIITVVKSQHPLLPMGGAFTEASFPLPELLTDDIQQCLASQKTKTFTTKEGVFSVLIEVLTPPVQLIICGGNYDIYPLLRIAKELGWRSVVACNPLKINKIATELSEEIIPKNELSSFLLDAFTAVVLMNHDYNTDYAQFQVLQNKSVRYLGVLGPRKRLEKFYDQAISEGTPIINTQHIYGPVGLDIGASTPEEIATAIIAEILTVFSQKDAQFLRLKQGPIYEN